MIRDTDLEVVGKVNKTHGINGEMSASFFNDSVLDAIDVDTCLLFKIDGLYVPFFVDAVRPRGADSLLIAFDGEDSQEAAAAFVGADIYMRKEDIPEPEEADDGGFYAAQLIGFTALTDDGDSIGEIIDIDDSTENPLFIISNGSDSKQVYIPIVDEFITDIDTEGRIITFVLPEGLLQL